MDRGSVRVIQCTAPTRVCDNGGWTDTWFAHHGCVFSIAVEPAVEVQLRVWPRCGDFPWLEVVAENFGRTYVFREPTEPVAALDTDHPLLNATIALVGLPHHLAGEIRIFSDAPPGCSIGTSAAVSVALIGALDAVTPGRLTLREVAETAHRVETQILKQECGIQDQIASAYGGINLIKISRYPDAAVVPAQLADAVLWELDRRLVLVFTGFTHSSADVHKLVINGILSEGSCSRRLESLRRAAMHAFNALHRGDIKSFGQSMIQNTDAQEQLSPSLIGSAHRRIIAIARHHHAAGWKVNGAGGNGGSVCILAADDSAVKRAMIREIEQERAGFRVIPMRVSRTGMRRWELGAPRSVGPRAIGAHEALNG